MTTLCAEAMGIKTEVHPIRGAILRHWFMDGNVEREYNPLHDDAQSMALVKRFRLRVFGSYPPYSESSISKDWIVEQGGIRAEARALDLNLAIVECVARMQGGK